MGRHRLDGVPPSDELLLQAALAIVREWGAHGVSIEEALAAVRRNFAHLHRLGPLLGPLACWQESTPAQPTVIDLTDPPGPAWFLAEDHGQLVYARVET